MNLKGGFRGTNISRKQHDFSEAGKCNAVPALHPSCKKLPPDYHTSTKCEGNSIILEPWISEVLQVLSSNAGEELRKVGGTHRLNEDSLEVQSSDEEGVQGDEVGQSQAKGEAIDLKIEIWFVQ